MKFEFIINLYIAENSIKDSTYFGLIILLLLLCINESDKDLFCIRVVRYLIKKTIKDNFGFKFLECDDQVNMLHRQQ